MKKQARTPLRPRRRKWIFVVSAVLAALVSVTGTFSIWGKSDAPKSRLLTADEADRLAVVRFRNYQATGRALTLTVPTALGVVTVRGSVDFRARVGYAVLTGTGKSSSTHALIQWTMASLAETPVQTAALLPPATPPPTGWISRPLSPEGSTLDAALTLVLSLSSDRPDNAQLITQGGARWLGRTAIHGVAADEMLGPVPSAPSSSRRSSTVRYWVSADGLLLRLQASIATALAPATLEFGGFPYTPVHPLPGLQAPSR